MSNQKYEAFIKTAELGSFKKAAEALDYTQAGISYMLNTLEDEMGVALFLRDYGGVRLTSVGEQILPFIREICNSERRLNSKLNELKNMEAGTICVAALTSVSIHWLPGMIRSFLNDYPKIEFDLRWSDNLDEVERMIWRGDVDCGFLILPAKSDLVTIPLKREPMLVILPEGHPLADSPFIQAAELCKYPYIGAKEGSYPEVDEIFSRHGVKPNVFITVENDYTAMSLVSKGFGFSIFPELSLKGPTFPFIRKELEIPAYRDLAIAIRSYDTASTATKNFLNCIQQWVKDFYEKSS